MFIHKIGLSFCDKMCYNLKMNTEVVCRIHMFDPFWQFPHVWR